MFRALSFLFNRLSTRVSPLAVQVLTVVIAGVFVIGASLVTSRIIIDRSHSAANQDDAALTAARMDSRLADLQRFLSTVTEHPDQLSIVTAFNAHDQVRGLHDEAVSLSQLAPGPDADDIERSAAGVAESFDRFFNVQTPATAIDVRMSVDKMRSLLGDHLGRFAAEADSDQRSLARADSTSRLAVIAVAIASTLIVGLTSYFLGNRLRLALLASTAERDRLADLTAGLSKRNQQFDALYQIVNEVSDSLSMRYVVRTAVEEARKLVNADYVELRLVSDDDLVVLGTSDPEASPGPVPLGAGIAGRAAKRGKTMRLQSLENVSQADQERALEMSSALVVPLIVGARVLGAMSCWSHQPCRFDADDERILELMSSQVATAVAAADLHETSEQKAAHDVLTGLPNRRQLQEDEPEFDRLMESEERIAVAMLDVDHFKRFNDDYGHRVGDVTLQKVAEVMRSSLRDADRLYRYGGEEFLVVLQGVRRADASRLIERLRRAVERTILTGEQLEPVGPVTVSAGIALAPDHGRVLSDLVKAADDALYASKEGGRNRITVFGALPLAA